MPIWSTYPHFLRAVLSLIDIIRVFGEGTKALIGPNTTEHYLSSELLSIVNLFWYPTPWSVVNHSGFVLVATSTSGLTAHWLTSFRPVIGAPPLSAKGRLKRELGKVILVRSIWYRIRESTHNDLFFCAMMIQELTRRCTDPNKILWYTHHLVLDQGKQAPLYLHAEGNVDLLCSRCSKLKWTRDQVLCLDACMYIPIPRWTPFMKWTPRVDLRFASAWWGSIYLGAAHMFSDNVTSWPLNSFYDCK